jgi:hypothetical protein
LPAADEGALDHELLTFLLLLIPHPDSRAAAILVDELDARGFHCWPYAGRRGAGFERTGKVLVRFAKTGAVINPIGLETYLGNISNSLGLIYEAERVCQRVGEFLPPSLRARNPPGLPGGRVRVRRLGTRGEDAQVAHCLAKSVAVACLAKRWPGRRWLFARRAGFGRDCQQTAQNGVLCVFAGLTRRPNRGVGVGRNLDFSSQTHYWPQYQI